MDSDRLLEELRGELILERRRADLSHELTAALSSASTQAAVARTVFDKGLAVFGACAGALAMLSEEGEGEVEIVDHFGYEEAVAARWRRFPLSVRAPLTDAIRLREPVWVASRSEARARYPQWMPPDYERKDGVWAALPLVVGDRVLGALGLEYAAERTFAREEQAMLVSVAQRCAQALDRARSCDRLREAIAREREARAQAEQSARLAEMFVAILGHDLRTPLAAIRTAGTLLSRDLTGERQQHVLARLLSSADRMSKMIDQVLDLTRIRTGKVLLCQPRPADLGEIMARIRAELATDRPFQVDVEGPTKGMWDEVRLAQVFSNLLGNAIQHSPAGAAVSVRIDGRSPERVEVTVHNAGAIPAEVLPEVFEPFRQARRSGSGGLGLGLFITRAIVAAHGGTIEVASTEPDGTRFHLRLPRSGL
jgi:signal transduction histidine kinase